MRLFSLVALMMILAACNQENKPDVSHIKVDLKIERFEHAFFNIDTNDLDRGLAALNNRYPGFYPFYTEVILRIPNAKQPSGNPESDRIIKQIIAGYKPVNDSIQKKYGDLDWLRGELTAGFKNVKYYYPAYRIPGIITFVGTFDAPGIVLTPNYLGIGLQQFAGKDFSAYKDNEIIQMYPEYISRRFDKEYIAPNSMKAIVDDLYPDTSQSSGLIEQMIEKGKQWYLLDKFLPDAPDSVKTGYTQRQLEWCRANEGNIWGSILSNTPDIYTVDQERIQNYIGEAPFTQNMEASNSSPGNIGQWVGWQILRKFEKEHPKMSVQEVLATPSRQIFREAKYKPK